MLLRRFVAVCATSLVVGLFTLAGVVRAEDSLWTTDFAAAKAKAKSENKLLFVDFTGSDWCGWCKKLVAEVFSKDEFKTEAPKKFVLVELDYPTPAKKQSDEVKKQNKELAKQYKIQGYPTILVMEADGKVIAHTGYRPGGPKDYVKHLEGFVDAFGDIVKIRSELDKVKGFDRVKLLDKEADIYVTKLENTDSDDVMALSKEIVALDPDNKSGLKPKHEFTLLIAELTDLQQSRKLSEAKKVADKALALQGISGDQKQRVYLVLCECYFADRDFANIVASAQKGIDAAPNGAEAPQLKSIVQRFKTIVEAQEAVVKLKAELENAKGLDRAKILDKLVGTAGKLAGMSRDVSPQNIEDWSKEIVTLDADNKAGLKNKYEFRILVTSANKLAQQRKTAECEAEVAKAVALPGVTPDQIQEATLALMMCHLRSNDLDKALEAAKKALDAAPKGARSAMIKYYIAQIETQLKAKSEKK
jgi:thioredoxin-related protein